MRKTYSLAVVLALSSAGAFAADPVPVIELQIEDSPSSTTYNASGPLQGGSNDIMLLQQLQDEMRMLRGMVEKQQYQIRQMEQQQRDRYRDLDRRIAAGQSPSANGSQSSVSSPVVGDSGKGNTSVSPPAPLPAADSTPTDAQAYQQAFSLVRQKDFPAALAEFDKFIELYPDSVRLPNAYYQVSAQQEIGRAHV